MSDIDIRVDEFTSAETRERVIGALVSFNDAVAGFANHRSLTVVAEQDGETVGGLFGYTNWEWFFISQLWLADSVRRQGIGKRLVRAAEAEARQRGCRHAHVDTFSFQARPFYERLGYSVFGELGEYPAGHTRYFLQKRDLAAADR